MNLPDHLHPQRIFFLESKGKIEAIRELVELTCKTLPGLSVEKTFQAVKDREGVVSSWVAPGIAIPHARLTELGEFVVALGISKNGIEYESFDGKPVHLLVLILGDARKADRHILLLAEVARALRNEAVRQAVISARTEEQIYRILRRPEEIAGAVGAAEAADVCQLMLIHTLALAEEVGAVAILLHADALNSLEPLKALRTETPVLLVTRKKEDSFVDLVFPHRIIQLPFPGLNRANQVDLALLFALAQRFVSPKDRVVSLFGVSGSGILDSLMVLDLSREPPTFLPAYPADLLGDVAPQVLERVLQIATALSREGREGRPVGTLFVLGDYGKVRTMSRQMVINPFKGYSDEEKSILDPSLEETIKEFATIDGAFLIRGDGILQAAGTYLRPNVAKVDLPSGLGTRHAAAAGITAASAALAVAVSQSTGKVSLFKAGRVVLALDKAQG